MSGAQKMTAALSVNQLSVEFLRGRRYVRIVDDVSFELAKGASMCLLGESGSGKSVTLRALLRLFPANASVQGSIRADGKDVLAFDKASLRNYRGREVAMIFQEPMTALDPVFTIGDQIAEAIVGHEHIDRGEARKRALSLLERVQVPSARRRLDAYPHELSGGLRQRAMIALALSCSPKILLADEPTTALDATVQIQILQLLADLRRELNMSMIFVTHDLGVACEVAETIAVMYAGRLLETGPVAQILTQPKHPYTEGLLRSTVQPTTSRLELDPIPGAPPDIAALPPGCKFAPRCGYAQPICRESEPALLNFGTDHAVRCFKAELGASFADLPAVLS